MQLFELVSPRLFRPLAGPNRAFYAELLLLLWEECRHTADYSISRAEAVSRAEDYFAALAKPLALDADDAGDEAEQPTRDPHTLALGFLLRLRRTGWLDSLILKRFEIIFKYCILTLLNELSSPHTVLMEDLFLLWSKL